MNRPTQQYGVISRTAPRGAGADWSKAIDAMFAAADRTPPNAYEPRPRGRKRTT